MKIKQCRQDTMQTRHDAETTSEKLDTLAYAFVCLFWYDLLGSIHATNLSLQTIDLSLPRAVDWFISLKYYISELKNKRNFKEYLEKARSFSEAT